MIKNKILVYKFIFGVAGLFLLVWIWFEIVGSHAPHRCRWDVFPDLELGILKYNTRHGKLPSSLEEVVEEGFLPENGSMYYSLIKHKTIFRHNIHYSKCEFDIHFGDKVIVVSVPDEELAKWPFLKYTPIQIEIDFDTTIYNEN